MKMRRLGHVFLEKEVENGHFFATNLASQARHKMDAQVLLFAGAKRGARINTNSREAEAG
jgi:hypothetical protein